MKVHRRIPILLTAVALIGALGVLCGAASVPDAAASGRAEIEIECGERIYRYSDQPIEAPDHTVAETVARRKINAPLPEKLRMVDRCVAAGAEWKDAVRYSFPLMYRVVDAIVRDAAVESKDSTVRFRPNSRPMFVISREQEGRKVDESRLYREIYIALRQSARVKLRVTPERVAPAVTVYDNIALTHLRSRFSTDFSASNENRRHNITLSLSKINGTVLAPGQEFSFNATVGPRSAQCGFKEAKIIVAGEYKQGYGGGVCQTSTTVYNAALRADMNVTMARNHTLLPAYVPPSFDAMVNAGSSDMRFVNGGDKPVFIRAFASGGKATVEFYGTALPYTIGTESKELSRGKTPEDRIILDTERKYVGALAPAGERVRVSYSHASLRSEGYILYRDKAGRLLDRKKIRSDTYGNSSGIVAVAPADGKGTNAPADASRA